MKERPILFSSAMVRAILEGRKTQTRRIVKPQPAGVSDPGSNSLGTFIDSWSGKAMWCPYGLAANAGMTEEEQQGDRLWVRETWGYRGGMFHGALEEKDRGREAWFQYKADGAKRTVRVPLDFNGPRQICRCKGRTYTDDGPSPEHAEELTRYWAAWRPSIHMPRIASRLTLKVTEVRVQRLQEISEADAVAEGLIAWSDPPRVTEVRYGVEIGDVWEKDPQKTYARLWDSINGKRAPWESNPWVWALSFEVQR